MAIRKRLLSIVLAVTICTSTITGQVSAAAVPIAIGAEILLDMILAIGCTYLGYDLLTKCAAPELEDVKDGILIEPEVQSWINNNKDYDPNNEPTVKVPFATTKAAADVIERFKNDGKFQKEITPDVFYGIKSDVVTNAMCSYKQFGDVGFNVLNTLSNQTGMTFDELALYYWAMDCSTTSISSKSGYIFVPHGYNVLNYISFSGSYILANRIFNISSSNAMFTATKLGIAFGYNSGKTAPFVPYFVNTSGSIIKQNCPDLLYNPTGYSPNYYGIKDFRTEYFSNCTNTINDSSIIPQIKIWANHKEYENSLVAVNTGLKITGDIDIPITPAIKNQIDAAEYTKQIIQVVYDTGALKQYVEEVTGAIDKQTATNQTFFQGIYDKVLDFLQKILNAIMSLPQLLIDIANAVKNFVLPIPLAMSEFWQNLLLKIDTIIEKLSGLSLGDVGNIVLDYVWSIPQAMSDFWQSVLDWFQNIFDAIGQIGEDVSTNIRDKLEELFVPDQVALKDLVDDFKEKFYARTGLLSYPLVFLISFVAMIELQHPGDCILQFPELKNPVNGAVIYGGASYNVSKNFRDLGQIYEYYMFATDLIMIGLFLSLSARKIDQVLNN